MENALDAILEPRAGDVNGSAEARGALIDAMLRTSDGRPSDLDRFGLAICRRIANGKDPMLCERGISKVVRYIENSRLFSLVERITFEFHAATNKKELIRRLVNLFKDILGG